MEFNTESKARNNASSLDSGEFFPALERILRIEDMREKYEAFRHFYDDFRVCGKQFSHEHFAHEYIRAQIAPFSPAPVRPAGALRRAHSSPDTLSHIPRKHIKIARALHAIAHIEYSAITLALDSAYRFSHMPSDYYADWLEVADEEFRHFFALERLLGELGARYGDFPVHATLYEAMQATQESLIYRMGVVHRGLEAKGLDANPFVLQKLHALSSSFTGQDSALCGEIDRVFGVILADEIGHVSKGDRWWRFGVDELARGGASWRAQTLQAPQNPPHAQNPPNSLNTLLGALDSGGFDADSAGYAGDMSLHERAFLGLCAKFSHFSLCGKILHKEAREQAGFSQGEIAELQRFYARFENLKHAQRDSAPEAPQYKKC